MRKSEKIMKVGSSSFVIGILVVVGSLSKNIFVGADTTISIQADFAFKVGLIVGIALIILSVILFMLASASFDKNE
jgi:hypothetical protein